MTKTQISVKLVYILVSMSAGAMGSLIIILNEDITVLPLFMRTIFSMLCMTILLALIFSPILIKLYEIASALYAVNNNKPTEKVCELPFGVLGNLTQEANLIIENHVDFQSMRGRLYDQISEVAAQEERNRLARDLHDSIKQQVFSMNVSAAAAQAHLDNNPNAARAALLDVRQSAQEAMVEMRALLQQLAPAPLEKSGLIESLRQQMEALSYRSGAKISTDFDQLPSDNLLPIGAQETIFRIAQEALSNIARHARAENVYLTLKRQDDEAIVLDIQDDGQGFDTNTVKHGMGLNNMQRRVHEFIGAEIDLQSSVGVGTNLRILIPLKQEDDEEALRERRKQSEAIAKSAHHYYTALTVFVALSIAADVAIIRALFTPMSTWFLIGLTILGVCSIFVIIYTLREYRAKKRELAALIPADDAMYHYLNRYTYQGAWLGWLAAGFVLPELTIAANSPAWFTSLVGFSCFSVGIVIILTVTLEYHRYFTALLPYERSDAIQEFWTSILTGFFVILLMIATTFLPGTSYGIFILPENSDEWTSTYFALITIKLVVYYSVAFMLYLYWRPGNRKAKLA